MNFTQFLLILNARKWIVLGVLFATVTAAVAVSLWLPKEYTAMATLVVDAKSKDPLTGQLMPAQMFPGYMATQVDIIRSQNVAGRVVRDLELANAPGTRQRFLDATEGRGTVEQWLVGLLQQKLTVEPSRESSIITVGFTGTDPQFAALVANAFAKSYIETSLDLRVTPAKQTAAWFDQQIVRLRDNLDQAQQKLTAYQREKGLVESDERLDVETRRMAELAGQMIAAQAAAFDASSRIRDSASLPEVTNNPVVQNLKAQVAQGEGRLAELAKRVGENHPDYQRVLAELESYKAGLDQEMGTATRGVGATAGVARHRHSEISAAFESQKTKVLELKREREEAARLARDVENANRIYDAALQRYGQSRMEAQSTQTDIVLLNPATAPTEPSKPRMFLNVLLAAFVGSLLGVGTAFLIELLDRRVRSREDLTLALGIPVLGEISKESGFIAGMRQKLVRRPAAA